MPEQSTLFLEDSPAKTSAAPADRKGLKAKEAGYGLKCFGLFESSDPLGYWLRMSVEQSSSRSIQYGTTWKLSATKSGRSLYLHLRLEPRTSAKGFSSLESAKMWPTASATDYKGGASVESVYSRGRNPLTNNLRDAVEAISGGPDLQTAAGGQLNPDWVEQLQGFPEGWTNPDVDEPRPWQGWPAVLGARLWMTPQATNCGMTCYTTGRPLEKSTHLQAQVYCAEADMHGLVSDQYPYEFPRTVKRGKHRAARIKALGNAVVPQQAYPLFRAIAEMDTLIKEDELP